ncbi:mechanosensitive ion channel family protein [Clostridium lundense]|uniref:mechanosensitive ion channel family protein n=1 Tax=Clostridium lundense TaxID=319475 RepID=UPI0004849CEC|nr:mechanosensitive ion channel family protein [Clostridium lundense]
MKNNIYLFNIQWHKLLDYIDDEKLYKILYNTIRVVIILILMYIIIKVGNKVINRFVEKQSEMKFSLDERKSKTLGAVLKSILKYSVYFFGIFIIMEMLFGIQGLTFASIGGVAIGFGAQNIVKDIINGFFILFEDQYAVGDYVTIQDKNGIVESIELRITRMRDFNGDLHIIPNGSIREVTNHSRGNRGISVDVDIANDENVDKAILAIKEVCNKFKDENENIVDGPNVSGIVQLKETGTTIRIVGKVKPMTQWDIEMELRKRIKDVLDKENISRPYPRIRILKEE